MIIISLSGYHEAWRNVSYYDREAVDSAERQHSIAKSKG